MTKHPSEEKLETLVLRAIEQRNAASCYEIVRRKISSGKSLKEFLVAELTKEMGSRPDPTFSAPFNVPGEIDVETLDLVMGASDRDPNIDMTDNPDPICCLAREMLKFKPAYLGNNLDKREKAEMYIYMAADNPRVGCELPESGLAFWRAAAVGYKGWKAMNRRKVVP